MLHFSKDFFSKTNNASKKLLINRKIQMINQSMAQFSVRDKIHGIIPKACPPEQILNQISVKKYPLKVRPAFNNQLLEQHLAIYCRILNDSAQFERQTDTAQVRCKRLVESGYNKKATHKNTPFPSRLFFLPDSFDQQIKLHPSLQKYLENSPRESGSTVRSDQILAYVRWRVKKAGRPLLKKQCL